MLYRTEIQTTIVRYDCVVDISSEDFEELKNNEISVESLSDKYDAEFELDFDKPGHDEIDMIGKRNKKNIDRKAVISG